MLQITVFQRHKISHSHIIKCIWILCSLVPKKKKKKFKVGWTYYPTLPYIKTLNIDYICFLKTHCIELADW